MQSFNKHKEWFNLVNRSIIQLSTFYFGSFFEYNGRYS